MWSEKGVDRAKNGHPSVYGCWFQRVLDRKQIVLKYEKNNLIGQYAGVGWDVKLFYGQTFHMRQDFENRLMDS